MVLCSAEDHLKISWQPLAAQDFLWNLILKQLLQLSPMSVTPLLQGWPHLWMKFCMWYLSMLGLKNSNSMKCQNCILRLNKEYFIHGNWSIMHTICAIVYIYDGWLCKYILKVQPNNALIHTKVLRYHMINFSKKMLQVITYLTYLVVSNILP